MNVCLGERLLKRMLVKVVCDIYLTKEYLIGVVLVGTTSR